MRDERDVSDGLPATKTNLLVLMNPPVVGDPRASGSHAPPTHGHRATAQKWPLSVMFRLRSMSMVPVGVSRFQITYSPSAPRWSLIFTPRAGTCSSSFTSDSL